MGLLFYSQTTLTAKSVTIDKKFWTVMAKRREIFMAVQWKIKKY